VMETHARPVAKEIGRGFIVHRDGTANKAI
jgi:hypothetical protein